jgi:histidinol-phosphate/aromatic aminotransferase/cobyric acid decarboxylase-like protein
MVGTATVNLGNIAAGATASFTVTVQGARPDKGHTVQLGPPSNWNQNLDILLAHVTANNTVTVIVRNPTGGGIDPDSGLWGMRVMP